MGEWGAALVYVRGACRRQTLLLACFHVRGASGTATLCNREAGETRGQGNKQNSALAQP
ncbi:hypothetical protein [Nostoc sp. 'Peltigera malacea cyanobiont' DB3992]|uniref:hypothetical protein n=1 Tax=Nostoc sp. 'Peltigera malacea cyanobiont' DB3992 TaxID=1206980 RepID=UPI0015D508E3|nr:hypothetical protein [Nostoc sp. 'Peltigera malacea cyanobiont' DB3992]